MSDDDNLDDNNEGDGIKSLRKQYENEKKARADLEQRLAAFEKKERESSVAEFLKAKGAPKAAAKFYTDEDTSEDAVGKWLEANADVFQIKTSDSAPGDPAPDANAQAAQRVTAQSYGATPAVPTPNGASVDPIEGERLMRTLPYEELEKLGFVPPRDKLHGVRKGQ